MRGLANSPLFQHQRYVHARQFKRANRALKKLRTYLGRVISDIARKIAGDGWLEEMVFGRILSLARRVRDQDAASAGPKVYLFRSSRRKGSVSPRARRTVLTTAGPGTLAALSIYQVWRCSGMRRFIMMR
jgi:hypothetical protein